MLNTFKGKRVLHIQIAPEIDVVEISELKLGAHRGLSPAAILAESRSPPLEDGGCRIGFDAVMHEHSWDMEVR
jgi:hypothetical protein